jgi:hypothetical protein
LAVEVWPDPDLTGGSVRLDGHDRLATCGHAKEHRGPMNAARRDEILTKYGLPPGTHPDYEIDHLIPLCLGGGDDPSNLWPQMRGRALGQHAPPTIRRSGAAAVFEKADLPSDAQLRISWAILNVTDCIAAQYQSVRVQVGPNTISRSQPRLANVDPKTQRNFSVRPVGPRHVHQPSKARGETSKRPALVVSVDERLRPRGEVPHSGIQALHLPQGRVLGALTTLQPGPGDSHGRVQFGRGHLSLAGNGRAQAYYGNGDTVASAAAGSRS